MNISNRMGRLVALTLAVASLQACWWHRQRYEPADRGERHEQGERHEREHERHEEHEERR